MTLVLAVALKRARNLSSVWSISLRWPSLVRLTGGVHEMTVTETPGSDDSWNEGGFLKVRLGRHLLFWKPASRRCLPRGAPWRCSWRAQRRSVSCRPADRRPQPLPETSKQHRIADICLLNDICTLNFRLSHKIADDGVPDSALLLTMWSNWGPNKYSRSWVDPVDRIDCRVTTSAPVDLIRSTEDWVNLTMTISMALVDGIV